MRLILKRVLSFSLALLCVCAVGVVSGIFDLEASAATTYYEANEAEVILRTGPSSSHKTNTITVKKGTVLQVVGSTTNDSGNLWYRLGGGYTNYYVFSERVKKHTHAYSGGICTNSTCKYEWPYKVTGLNMVVVVTNPDGCPHYNRPYSNNSYQYGTYKVGTALTINAMTTNQAGNGWLRTSGNTWLYAGNVMERFSVTYNVNGGSGSFQTQYAPRNHSVTIPSAKPTRVGYEFAGWSSTSTSYQSGVSYLRAGSSMTVVKNTTLNAIWKPCAHDYGGGICNKCNYEWPYKVRSVSAAVQVTNADGCTYYNRPYSSKSTNYGIYKVGTVLTITGATENQAGNPWLKTNNGYWIYAGNVTQRYSVSYDLNGGSGNFPTQYHLANTCINLHKGVPTRVGYNFKGWDTSPDATLLVDYDPGDVFSQNKSVKLYAIWAKCSHASYTGGICDKCKYEYPLSTSALSCSVKVTNADGCSYYNRPYSKNSTKYGVFKKGTNLTINAQVKNQEGNLWLRTTEGYWVFSGNLTQRFIVQYDLQGGINGPAVQEFLTGKSVKISTTKPTRVGYTFKGWSKSASSSTVAYKGGETYSTKQSLKLYAVWAKCSHAKYTGGICTTCNYEAPLTITDYNATFMVSNSSGAKNWSRPYSNNSKHLSTSPYRSRLTTVKRTVNKEGNVWYQLNNGNWVFSENVKDAYWISFNANGGSNPPTAIADWKGTNVTLPVNVPTRTGYNFVGWSTSPSGPVQYQAGGKYTVNGSATLYAQWETGVAITRHPASVYVTAGTKANFSVGVSGSGVSYQWQRMIPGGSWTNLTNCTTYGIVASGAIDQNGHMFRCIVKDRTGKTGVSAPATLYVLGVKEQPKTVYAKDGETASTSVTAVGGELTYKWYVANSGDTSFVLSDITTNTYSVAMNKTSAGRAVYCVVTDKAGNTVKTDTVYLRMKASVLKQPKTTYAKSGAKIKVTMKAAGEGLKYTWYYKNTGDSGYTKSSITSATYSTTMNSKSNGRLVYCVVTDKYGNTEKTKTATLRMSATIKTQPKTTYAKSGSTVKVSVKAAGEGLKYTWYIKSKGDSSFKKSSVTKSVYSTTMNSKSKDRQIYCVVQDKYGKKARTKTVSLRMKATVTAQPKTKYAKSGETVKITVKAAGDGLTYTWYFKNAGAKSYSKSSSKGASYTTTMSSKSMDRQVYCIVKDKYGNKVKTKTAYLRMEASIITQPKSVAVASGKTAKVTVKAAGEGLDYTWYVKDKGASKFKKSSEDGASYSVKVTSKNSGRQVYCIVTDMYGNTAKTKTVTIKKK